jgi:hypothetical protein
MQQGVRAGGVRRLQVRCLRTPMHFPFQTALYPSRIHICVMSVVLCATRALCDLYFVRPVRCAFLLPRTLRWSACNLRVQGTCPSCTCQEATFIVDGLVMLAWLMWPIQMPRRRLESSRTVRGQHAPLGRRTARLAKSSCTRTQGPPSLLQGCAPSAHWALTRYSTRASPSTAKIRTCARQASRLIMQPLPLYSLLPLVEPTVSVHHASRITHLTSNGAQHH